MSTHLRNLRPSRVVLLALAPLALVVAEPAEAGPERARISGEAREGSILTLRLGADSRGRYSVRWQRCTNRGRCARIVGASKLRYRVRAEDVGGTLRVVARRGGARPLTRIASTGLVRPSAPALAEAPALSGTAQEGQTVSVAAGSWTSSSPVGVVYQWRRCSAARACTAIAGARSSSYRVQTLDVDSSLEVFVTAANAGGGASYSLAFPRALVPAPPRSTSAATVTGFTYEGATLVGESGSWASSRPVGTAYSWLRCDYWGANCARVEGATSRVYVLGRADVWKTLKFVVEGSNGGGAAISTSAATRMITPTPPRNIVLPAISGEAVEARTLTASTGTWESLSPLTFTYRWRRCDSAGNNCRSISGAVAPTYVLTSREVGATVRVVVTASTGLATAAATSAPTPVVAAASVATVQDEPPLTGGASAT